MDGACLLRMTSDEEETSFNSLAGPRESRLARLQREKAEVEALMF